MNTRHIINMFVFGILYLELMRRRIAMWWRCEYEWETNKFFSTSIRSHPLINGRRVEKTEYILYRRFTLRKGLEYVRPMIRVMLRNPNPLTNPYRKI